MKFSIITPVYNVASYIGECLDSIEQQTFSDWEVVCVDDGSTDESGVILDSYACRDRRIKVIHKKNEGVSVARNEAISLAHGDYLVFVDGDDVIESRWLASVDECVEKTDADIVRLDFRYWNGGKRGNCQEEYTSRLIDSQEGVLRWAAQLRECLYGWRHVIRRKLVEDLRFVPGLRRNEDVLFLIEAVFRARSICECSYSGYLYRQRQGSADRAFASDEETSKFLAELFVLWRDVYANDVIRRKPFKEWISWRTWEALIERIHLWDFRCKMTMPVVRKLIGAKCVECQYVRNRFQFRLCVNGGVIIVMAFRKIMTIARLIVTKVKCACVRCV